MKEAGAKDVVGERRSIFPVETKGWGILLIEPFQSNTIIPNLSTFLHGSLSYSKDICSDDHSGDLYIQNRKRRYSRKSNTITLSGVINPGYQN